MSSRYKTLLEDTFIFGLGSLGSKLILFLMVPLYTNYMNEAEYGTADLVFTISQLVEPFLCLVIYDAVVRFGLSKNEKRENVLLVGILVFICSVFLGLFTVPIINLYSVLSEWKWYLYVYIVAHIANGIGYTYLKAKGKNKAFAFIGVSQTAVSAGLSVYFLVFQSMSIKGYLLASILSNLIIDIIIIKVADIINDIKVAKLDLYLLKRMVVYSSPLILNNISWWVIHSSDKVMVEAMISISALGIYTAAAKIPALINVMATIFQQAWSISAIKEIESSNDSNYYATVFNYLFIFVSGACIFFVSIMKVFMRYYVGVSFIEAWHYVPLLLVSAVFASIGSYYGSMYGALKKSVNNMISTLLAAVVNILLNFILIPLIGIYGAVVGTLVAYIAIAFIRLFDVKRCITIHINWKSFIATCLIIIVHAILVSLDIYICIVSIIAMLLFLICNYNEIHALSIIINNVVSQKILKK